MGRILSAMLLSVVAVVILLTPSTGADVAKEPPRPVLLVAISPVTLRSAPVVSHVRRAAPSVLVPVARAAHTTPHILRVEWQRVAVCEVGGNWKMVGPAYSGIGFANSTWLSYGGARFARLAGLATADEQIVIGMRVTKGWVPDQSGCDPRGW